MKFSYYAIFEYASEEEINNGIYPIGIYFPDLLGCVSGADNTEQGLEMAKEAMEIYIETELSDKKFLPNPTEKKELEKNLMPNEKLFKIDVNIL